jgi:transcriptional regulator with XRE-family HTH domain
MRQFAEHQRVRIYRKYLGLSQSELAGQMGTLPNTVARWESGEWTITQKVLCHIRKLVELRLKEQMHKAFAEIMPELPISEFTRLFGIPTVEFAEDNTGRLYVGIIFIDGCREYTLHFSVEDGSLWAIGRGGSARRMDEALLRKIR